jgi:transcriptional regulator GlxA family with amidase domain
MECEVVLVAEENRPVTSANGMRVLPDRTLGEVREADVVLVPGGIGTRKLAENTLVLDWLKQVSARASWVTSVCTGSLVLYKAGLARGKRVTTHWSFVEALRAKGDITVLENVRFVRDGNVLTAAGVSAGIDMALWLVGQVKDAAFAREVQRWIEYYPAPPYAAEV